MASTAQPRAPANRIAAPAAVEAAPVAGVSVAVKEDAAAEAEDAVSEEKDKAAAAEEVCCGAEDPHAARDRTVIQLKAIANHFFFIIILLVPFPDQLRATAKYMCSILTHVALCVNTLILLCVKVLKLIRQIPRKDRISGI